MIWLVSKQYLSGVNITQEGPTHPKSLRLVIMEGPASKFAFPWAQLLALAT